MSDNPTSDLAAELSAMALKDEQELLTFLPLAARLAALGDRSHLDRWPPTATRLRCDIERLLVDRCKEGEWELRESSEEDLGLSVIAVQDFACLLELDRDLLPATVRRSIEAWVEAAESTPLDAGAVEILETFLDRFPIPEPCRLGVVDSPLTLAERELVARMLPPPRVVDVTLRFASARVPELQLADAGKAPSVLISSFELTGQEVRAGEVGRFTLTRRLHEDWRVVVDLLDARGLPASARAMRLGRFPGGREGNDEPWVVNLSRAPVAQRIAALGDPMVFQLSDGTRLKITCLPSDSLQA